MAISVSVGGTIPDDDNDDDDEEDEVNEDVLFWYMCWKVLYGQGPWSINDA